MDDRADIHLVTAENGPRPAGKPDQCFYCNQPIGQMHKGDCVCRERTIIVRTIIEYPIRVPESWTKELIEFQRNESSWCADNIIDELTELKCNCICSLVSVEYVREATKEENGLVGDR